jgi:hypothetical protein
MGNVVPAIGNQNSQYRRSALLLRPLDTCPVLWPLRIVFPGSKIKVDADRGFGRREMIV